MRKILIFDALNTFIRNFCVVPAMDMNGEPVGGIVGFIRSVKFLIKETEPDLVIAVWDGEGGSRKRRGIFKEYKAGRKVRLNREYEQMADPKAAVENLSSQIRKLHGFLDCLGVVQVECPEVEADDAIAFICKYIYTEDAKIIVSTDRDMLQLIDSTTMVYSPTKKVVWSKDKVIEEIGVLPENYVYVKALMGDKSDNIPGVGGVGEATAVKLFPFLVERQTTAEEILSSAEANVSQGTKYKSIVEKRERFLENVKLMQLSNPIFGVQSASIIRTSATQQRPKFALTELRLGLSRHGINITDSDLEAVFSAYRRRVQHGT